ESLPAVPAPSSPLVVRAELVSTPVADEVGTPAEEVQILGGHPRDTASVAGGDAPVQVGRGVRQKISKEEREALYARNARRGLQGFAVWTMTNDRSFKLFAALTRDEQVHAAQWNEFVATHRVIDLENHFANAASLEHWLVGGIQSGSLAGSRVASYSATPIYY